MQSLSAGFVTTARVTHATPAALYAHTYDRVWECDNMFDVSNPLSRPPEDLHDIAYQLVHGQVGRKLNVAIGGGYPAFFPVEMKEELYEMVCYNNIRKFYYKQSELFFHFLVDIS